MILLLSYISYEKVPLLTIAMNSNVNSLATLISTDNGVWSDKLSFSCITNERTDCILLVMHQSFCDFKFPRKKVNLESNVFMPSFNPFTKLNLFFVQRANNFLPYRGVAEGGARVRAHPPVFPKNICRTSAYFRFFFFFFCLELQSLFGHQGDSFSDINAILFRTSQRYFFGQQDDPFSDLKAILFRTSRKSIFGNHG